MPSRYHHGNLRAVLLEQAEQTVRDGGVHALSLRELARDVGVSHAAPRRHFSDRQALLDALAENGFDRLGNELEAAIRDAGDGFDGRLQAMAHAYVGFATQHAELLEIMFAGKHREGADRIRAAGERTMAVSIAVIVDAQQNGELIAGDPGQIAISALAILHGLAGLANNGMLGDNDLHTVVTETIDRLLSGLQPR